MTAESSGTRQLSIKLAPAFRALDKGRLFVLDEIDSGFPRQAAQALIALYTSPKTNPNGAQLICTTYNTTPLHTDTLHPQLSPRDEIWFTKKDEEGATELYSLGDFTTRASGNFERGYLQGRFGARAHSGSFADFRRRL